MSRVEERLTNDYFDITLIGSEGLAVSGRGNNAWNAYVAALNILNAKILFSKSNLLVSKLFEPGTDGKRKSLEKHHLFPKAYLKALGYNDAKINQMANYAFIDWKDNITKHNRFSPPGVEWLYLAIGDPCVAETCALKECRAEAGELFGLCQFKLNEDYSEKTLVDLTIAEDVLYEDLNRQLENSADEIRNREVKKAVDSIMRKGYAKTPDVSDIKEKFTRWAAYTYARLLSKQIFVPVETEDKELMYSPFQCMAQYFLSLGYAGIIYSSTVFSEGKNVVLFDKDAATPMGKIKKINV